MYIYLLSTYHTTKKDMTTPNTPLTSDVYTIPNVDNLQKYCFVTITKPLYFQDSILLGMIQCRKADFHFC